MITCSANNDLGVMTISGITPNGAAIITRNVTGSPPLVLRNGAQQITGNGFLLYDTEAPFGVPLRYVASITGLTTTDRLIQQNLMPTPTFTHGVQGWLAGSGAGRVLTVEADPTAHSSLVGHFTGSTSGAVPPAAPTLVGHVDSTVLTSASYTLTPPITGGTAIATNDWMLLVHQQLAAVSAPATPAGWALVDDTTNGVVRQIIWSLKRNSTDQGAGTGYTVTVTAGALATASLLWVRGATQDVLVKSPTVVPSSGLGYTQQTTVTTVLRPRLTLSLFSGVTSIAATAPTAASVSGGTWQYTRASGTNSRTLVVASDTDPNAGNTPQVVTTYNAALTAGVAAAVSFQVAASLTNRIVARGKITTLAGAATPYLLTGRFRFSTTTLNTWQNIKDTGTWQQVKTAKVTWLGVRGSASTVPADFLKLFLTIVNPATGADYITPVQVMATGESALNTWIDFSALFTTGTSIPSTAEIQLVHGTKVPEYATDWYLDEFGITPGAQRAAHNTLYWFDGDSPLPADPADNLMPDQSWDAATSDSSITWTGTVGNSISQFLGPSGLSTATTCQLDTPALVPCEPVFLSDPVNTSLGIWVGLLTVDDLTHPSKMSVYQVLSRAPAVAISQIRGWETGSLTVLTSSVAARTQMLKVFQSGRILLLRNPDPSYPERDWYLACGDLVESRPIPNARVPERTWKIPFTRVERPTGLIEASGGVTWADVLAAGTWSNVRNEGDWLDVLTGTPA